MSMDELDAQEDVALDRLYNDFGPQWAEEHRDELYEDSIKQFTAERLRSYYLAHPNLAQPASDSLMEAQSLRATYPKAALVTAATAIELGIKSVLLKPIVFGLVHTEALADLITDLATQHTGVDRFHALLSEILKQYGGVDLQTFTRTKSTLTLWEETKNIQNMRNRVIHRGEMPDECQDR